MEPRKDEKTIEARKEEKKKHFRIVKLEERIAPNKGGIPNGGQHHSSTSGDSGF